MLQLSLIRHAKSSWGDPSLSDYQRPLNKRGLKNAPLMGAIIREQGLQFDCMVASPARRAITTARLIAREAGFAEDRIQEIENLYAASTGTLLQCVQSLNPDCRHAALVAHNPGLTSFCNYLCDAGIDNLPTCAVAVIESDLDDWQAVYRSTGRLVRYEYPRKYMS